ncbi:Zn-dependent protease with chaperone function [Luteimonas cucumeris]|uniref:Zn-dependent protease with chaperone function n=1 Tax=Luteimonas cucumeris TaxID=985012 RepID=A0A562LFC5_9GAMM|nr:M48 family metallopeptidase [Luteimonas cucumeris]TWI06313.1 Zn-dependent protease with chaperone function [Luteimonas cucumeris]
MNFFERQAAARRTSTRLIVLFALAVVGIVAAVDLAVLLVFGGGMGALVVTSLLTLAVIGFGSLYRMASLRGGGEPVALQLGGTQVPEDTTDIQLRRLRNVVEEIAIASGVPVPKIFVLEHEAAINALAAGYSPSDAVIAVTRGALEQLNRDELQGVIAHEFSHVLNGDMRLNIRLIGVLFGILMLSLIGQRILVYGRFGSRGRGAGGVVVAALIALAVGYIGLFFGRMIKAGVSRTRESLADASAVQFTRQTSGLAGALKKIAASDGGSTLTQRGDAEEVSHMLFGDGVGFSGLFATHPPLLKRIQALEPSFRAEQLEELRRRWRAKPPGSQDDALSAGTTGERRSPLPILPVGLPGAAAALDLTPPMVAAQVAQPSSEDYQRADSIVAAIPEQAGQLARQRDSVVPLLLGLLLDPSPQIQARQRTEIEARLGADMAATAQRLKGESLDALHPMLRLPLAAMAFPVLRLRPRPELDTFMDTVHAVVHADGRVSLFEYCLGRLLEVQVRESLDPSQYARFGRRKAGSVKQEFATLLAVAAQAGHEDAAAAQRAYLAGMQRVLPRDHVPYAPPADGVLALDAVWEPLDALDPLAKQVMVEAITAAVSHDGRVTVAEAELLRTICGALHCPLPPMLERN